VYQLRSQKGVASGYASLDASAEVPIDELPVGTGSTDVAAGDHTHSAPAIDDLSDVNAPSPSNGDVLTWDSTPGEWVASAAGAPALDGLADVDATSPSDGDVLTWSDGDSAWVNAVVPGNLLNKYDATAAPTADDDEVDGYSVGSIWVDVTNDAAYICVDATEGAAVWNPFEGAGDEPSFPVIMRQTYNSVPGGWDGQAWPTANTAFFVPIVIPTDCTVEGFTYLTGGTATVGSNLDIGLYSAAGSLLTSTGSTAYTTGSANTHFRIAVTPYDVTAGMYYLGMVNNTNNTGNQFGRIVAGRGWCGSCGGYVRAGIGVPLPSDNTSWTTSTTESRVPIFGVLLRSESI
jgi:hypothetical protein